MSSPSRWPLNPEAMRIIVPQSQLDRLARSPLSQGCYPLAMGFYPNAAGHSVERSQHDDHLLIYCVEGRGHLTSEGFDGPVRAGDVVILPSGNAHAYRALKRLPWTIYWFHFAGSYCQELIHRTGYQQSAPIIKHGVDPQLTADIRRLLGLRRGGLHFTAWQQGAALTQQILLHISMQHRLSSRQSHRSFDVESVQALMQARLSEDVSLEDLAAAANLSKYHFSNKYKKLTGHAPIQHFIEMKMERACYLLDTSEDSIKAIASTLGYEDPLYFSRQFQKTIGLSPSGYREQRKA